jgi:hypothetical protein
MNCVLDGQDASYFVAPAHPLDPGWVYALVGTLLGEGKQGWFTAALRSCARPDTERGPLSSGQRRPMIIRFAQP